MLRASPSSPSASLPLILTLPLLHSFLEQFWFFKAVKITETPLQLLNEWRVSGGLASGELGLGFSSDLMPWVFGWAFWLSDECWAGVDLSPLAPSFPLQDHSLCAQFCPWPLDLPVPVLELVLDADSWLWAADWCPGWPPRWTVVLILGKHCCFEY